MEICQFCGMYMKPIFHKERITCEFCGKEIAKKEKDKWIKTLINKNKQNEKQKQA